MSEHHPPAAVNTAREQSAHDPLPEYVLEQESGDVHLVNPMGDGQFTFCDREYRERDSGEGPDGEFASRPDKGPATCRKCKGAVDRFLSSVKLARWSLRGGSA